MQDVVDQGYVDIDGEKGIARTAENRLDVDESLLGRLRLDVLNQFLVDVDGVNRAARFDRARQRDTELTAARADVGNDLSWLHFQRGDHLRNLQARDAIGRVEHADPFFGRAATQLRRRRL